MRAIDTLLLARPAHWIKNVIVLAPLVFSRSLDDPRAWGLVGLAVLAFCLASSAVYILNDVTDRDRDRRHPHKKDRLLASGRVGAGPALAEAAVLAAAGLVAGGCASLPVAALVLAYLALQVGYTFVFQGAILLDVVCIALGFVLRAAAGAVAIDVEVSPWLVVCTFTLCLFLGFCKRRSELAAFENAELAGRHRPTLHGYTPELLTHLITLTAGIAIISYLLYASHPLTVQRFHTINLVYTLPAVIYGVSRFAMLSMRGTRRGPMDIILRDWPFQLAVLCWLAAAVAIIYWPKLTAWLEAAGR
jgi:decaprenyl-phosphate phosphoribosyltransferase